MDNQDEGHAAVRGHMAEELLKSLQPSRGSAQPDDREGKSLFMLLSDTGSSFRLLFTLDRIHVFPLP
jgi:hypothetical protein